MSLSRDGAGEVLAGDAACTPRTTPEGAPWKALCPADFAISGAVDSAALPEGVNTFEAAAVDRAGNVERDRWSVLVDHTPPTGPQDVRFQDYSPERREAELTWEEDDPDLPGEVPGSGIARTEYRVLRGDTWSAWIETEEGAVTLENADPGEKITAQLHAIDVVGNKSLPTEILVEVPSGPSDEGEVEVEHQPSMMRAMQAFTPVPVCVPRIKKGRARHVAPDHQSFRPTTTRLGARMAVWCRHTDARDIDSVEVTASWFVWNDSNDDWDRIGSYGDDEEDFLTVRITPRDYFDVTFDGVDVPCLPKLGGKRKYAVGGFVKFRKDGRYYGEPKPYKSSNKHLRCPDKAERFRRALAGWDELVRLRSPHSDGTNRPGHVQLAKSLDLPNLPDWKVDRAWTAHHIVPANKSKVHDLQVMMFRCRIHPNSTTNGVYLRDFGLKKTKSGRINPDWKLLEQRSRELAHRTYHGDTFSERYDNIVRDMVSRGMQAALTGDETCSGEDVRNLRSDLADIEERLKNGNLGMQNPDN